MRKRTITELDAQRAVKTLLEYLGEDAARDGLKDTPKRVVRAWEEMCSGYEMSPEATLSRNFTVQNYDQIIACPWVEFTSTCEHHLLPFTGYAHIGYLPAIGDRGKVVGLSKMARVVDIYARRLQIQERLTEEIAAAMANCLKPRGVAVIVQAKHQCMMCRGVKKHSAVMMTSSMHGAFRASIAAREEFLRMIELAKSSND